jgi:hypothetical protein
MESPLAIFDVHWDHEPVRIPLNRPPGTFSPTGGEGWDEGVRFMESARILAEQEAGYGRDVDFCLTRFNKLE